MKNESIRVAVCANHHRFFYPHTTCPECGERTEHEAVANDAVLISRTTVRMTSSGAPYQVGLAKASCGASTLCLIDDETISAGDEVKLRFEEGLFLAQKKGTS